jgi:uncharacterized protein YjbI with pentapeptide repeats
MRYDEPRLVWTSLRVHRAMEQEDAVKCSSSAGFAQPSAVTGIFRSQPTSRALSATEARNCALEQQLREIEIDVRTRATELERVRARRAVPGNETAHRRKDASPCAFNPRDKGQAPGGNGIYLERGKVSCALTTRLDALKDLSNARLRCTDMSGHDLRNVNLSGADLRGCDLRLANLTGARLPKWDSGLFEGVQLAGAMGWLPADRDLTNAKLKSADLSGCDLSGFNLSHADLELTILRGASLCGANLQGARGGRAVTVDVTAICTPSTSRTGLWNDLKLDKPVVFANTEACGIRLHHIILRNFRGPTSVTDNNDCVRRMSVRTAQRATGPWVPVVTLTAAKTSQEQKMAVPPDSPALGEFVQVSVHETYGGEVCVRNLQLHGDAWG